MDFLNRLFRREQPAAPDSTPDPSVTGVRMYWREQGPIAYEARVFRNPAAGGALRADLAEQLLITGLDWLWESGRYSDEYQPVNPALPKRRALTALNEASAPNLSADLEEHVGGCPRWFTIYVAEQGKGDELLNPTTRQAALVAFSNTEGGPLLGAISQEGEADWEVVFTGHNPPDTLADLLSSWGISRATVVRTFNDRPTHGIFEATFELPQRKVE